MLSDIQHGKFGFTKGSIIAVIWFSLSRTLTVANLTLIVLSFGC
ncbi:putative membrane protein [Vibrio cholerae HE-25]|nr:putative membrane protein [Vibrio cholerae HE-25]